MNIEKKDELRDYLWETASGQQIMLRDMDISHIHNCINLIRKRAQREAETTLKSGKKFRVGIAKAEATAVTLKAIKGSVGGDLALEIKKNIEAKYNNSRQEITKGQIDAALRHDRPYQCLLHEVSCRERDTQEKIQEALNNTPQENFFESKGKTKVVNFSMRPDDIPMVVECLCDKTISRKIRTGDYIGINDDLFRITFIVRRAQAKSNNDLLELTLNARRQNEKDLVLKVLNKDEFYEIY